MFVCAVLGSLWQMLDQPYRAEQGAIRNLMRSAEVKTESTDVALLLLRRLLGDQITANGQRVSSIRIEYNNGGNRLPEGYLEPLKVFSCLRVIIVENAGFDRLPDDLPAADRIRAIGFEKAPISETCLRTVGRLKNLEGLHFIEVAFPPRGAEDAGIARETGDAGGRTDLVGSRRPG